MIPCDTTLENPLHQGDTLATYKQIQEYVKRKYDFVPKSCWIAHVKEMNELKPRVSARRYDPKKRQVPCPQNKVKPIEDAMRHFGMIS